MLRARPADGGLAALTLRAPAKVNLFLEIVAKRADGFHAVETLMLAVSLADTLEFAPADNDAIDLTCSDPGLSVGPDNLVVRAAEQLRQHAGKRLGATIRLTKRIPTQAGLGGGSSDAATTLVGLNRLWRLGLGVGELTKLAASLGSDTAFFLRPPAGWCTGRGEVIEPRTVGRRLHLVLVKPSFGLATADVYRGARVPDAPMDGTALQAAMAAGDVVEMGRRLHNRLQQPAEVLRPELASLRARLAAVRPAGWLLSGSGSTMFALARDFRDARRIAEEVLAGGPADGTRTWIVRSWI